MAPRDRTMVAWRFKAPTLPGPASPPGPWKFGYVTQSSFPGLIRMGRWNGDDMGGELVSVQDIEWKAHE